MYQLVRSLISQFITQLYMKEWKSLSAAFQTSSDLSPLSLPPPFPAALLTAALLKRSDLHLSEVYCQQGLQKIKSRAWIPKEMLMLTHTLNAACGETEELAATSHAGTRVCTHTRVRARAHTAVMSANCRAWVSLLRLTGIWAPVIRHTWASASPPTYVIAGAVCDMCSHTESAGTDAACHVVVSTLIICISRATDRHNEIC